MGRRRLRRKQGRWPFSREKFPGGRGRTVVIRVTTMPTRPVLCTTPRRQAIAWPVRRSPIQPCGCSGRQTGTITGARAHSTTSDWRASPSRARSPTLFRPSGCTTVRFFLGRPIDWLSTRRPMDPGGPTARKPPAPPPPMAALWQPSWRARACSPRGSLASGRRSSALTPG
jgi:hypothetical protein